MELSEERKRKIKEEWDSLLNRSEPIRSDEKTVPMLIKEYNISENTARRKMNALVELGKVSVRDGFIDGRWCKIYRIIAE